MKDLNINELEGVNYITVAIKFQNGQEVKTNFFERKESKRTHFMRASEELLLNKKTRPNIAILSQQGDFFGFARSQAVHSIELRSESTLINVPMFKKTLNTERIISVMREVNNSSFLYNEDDFINSDEKKQRIVDDFRSKVTRWDTIADSEQNSQTTDA